MPHSRIGSTGLPPNARTLRATVLAAIAALWAAPAVARPAPDLERLDLTVRPTDVAPPPRARLSEPVAPSADAAPSPSVNPVEEVDKVERNPTPNRGTSLLGPLGSLGGEDGGVLQELLENKTIPLFRVRVKSPLQ